MHLFLQIGLYIFGYYILSILSKDTYACNVKMNLEEFLMMFYSSEICAFLSYYLICFKINYVLVYHCNTFLVNGYITWWKPCGFSCAHDLYILIWWHVWFYLKLSYDWRGKFNLCPNYNVKSDFSVWFAIEEKQLLTIRSISMVAVKAFCKIKKINTYNIY